MLAVKVCRKLRPPIGPSSPWAKKPAIGAALVAAATRAASWSGSPKKPRPRPLQENNSTPRGRHRATGVSSSSRSSSAASASRTWNWRVWPIATLSATAIEPVSGSAPSRPLTRKSPRSKLALCSSMTWPTWRPPPRSSSCSCWSRPASIWRSRSTAGRPPSSWTMLPSPRVTANGEPTGRQPWLTTARMSTGPTRATPTAPPSSSSVPLSRRCRPASLAPETIPPSTGRPGCSWLSRSRKLSAGKVNGSASRSTLARSSSGRSGQPPMPTPSSRGSTRSANGRTLTPGSRAIQTARPGSSSTSRPSPITPWAVQPMMAEVPVRSERLRAMPVAASACSMVKKQTTRSGAPPSWPRAAGMTSSRALAWSGAVETAAPKVSMALGYPVSTLRLIHRGIPLGFPGPLLLIHRGTPLGFPGPLLGALADPLEVGGVGAGEASAPDKAVPCHGLDQPLVPVDLEGDGDPPGMARQLATPGVAQQPRAPAAAVAPELADVDQVPETLALEVGHGLGKVADDQPVAAHPPEQGHLPGDQVGLGPGRVGPALVQAGQGELAEAGLDLAHRQDPVAAPYERPVPWGDEPDRPALEQLADLGAEVIHRAARPDQQVGGALDAVAAGKAPLEGDLVATQQRVVDHPADLQGPVAVQLQLAARLDPAELGPGPGQDRALGQQGGQLAAGTAGGAGVGVGVDGHRLQRHDLVAAPPAGRRQRPGAHGADGGHPGRVADPPDLLLGEPAGGPDQQLVAEGVQVSGTRPGHPGAPPVRPGAGRPAPLGHERDPPGHEHRQPGEDRQPPPSRGHARTPFWLRVSVTIGNRVAPVNQRVFHRSVTCGHRAPARGSVPGGSTRCRTWQDLLGPVAENVVPRCWVGGCVRRWG